MNRVIPVAILFGLTSIAFADAPPEVSTTARVAPARPTLTIMWAPLRLVIPLAELTAEYRVLDKLGVSLTAGAGKRSLSVNTMEVPGAELEAGGQVRYYFGGDFARGFELGGELLYERVHFDEPFPAGIVAAAAGGLTVGPFAGYKIATHIGFTFEAQLGARYLAVDPPIQGASGMMLPAIDRWLPLLHLNVGWSF